MSSASLFYGRRSRSNRSFNNLGFRSSPPPSSDPSSSDPGGSSSSDGHFHRHRKSDLHRRLRHSNLGELGDNFHRSSHILHHCTRSAVAESEPHERGCVGESPSRSIISRGTAQGVSVRYPGNNRLPGAVLLAKERLLQRLRGVSLSEIRHNGQTSEVVHCNNLWVADANFQTSLSREPPDANAIFTELPFRAHQQSAPREPNKRSLGLTKEALSKLHHEVFVENQRCAGESMSRASNDCSICLENFMEGHKLIILDCGHRFHALCLYPWLQNCAECPNCRSCIVIAS